MDRAPAEGPTATSGRAGRETAIERPVPAGIRSGDGVFETLRTYSGRPFLLEQHLARLRQGARAIGLAPVPSSTSLVRSCLEALSRARGGTTGREWVLRPMLYSASSGAKLRIELEPIAAGGRRSSASRLIAGISSYLHPGKFLTPPGAKAPVKWLARGPLAHALREARRRGWEEAILEDSRGRLVEGTRTNLLAVIGGTLVAPGPESSALPGITRAVALDDARRFGIPVEEHAPHRAELRAATEVMVTSSLLGIASLKRIVGVWEPPRPGPRTSISSVLRRGYDRRTGRTGDGPGRTPRHPSETP